MGEGKENGVSRRAGLRTGAVTGAAVAGGLAAQGGAAAASQPGPPSSGRPGQGTSPSGDLHAIDLAGKMAMPGLIDCHNHIVLMGTGEPLSNYDAIRSFVQTMTDRSGMGYSNKKVTISTCGLASAIERMADDTEMDASLAVSLNATTDELRDRIMPVNKVYPLARLMQALHYYCKVTANTVTIEYALFKGINDSDEDAARLMELLSGLPCMINVLMFNPFPGASFERPDEKRVYAFRNILVKHGFVAVVRNSRGNDINAACGQLRAASS